MGQVRTLLTGSTQRQSRQVEKGNSRRETEMNDTELLGAMRKLLQLTQNPPEITYEKDMGFTFEWYARKRLVLNVVADNDAIDFAGLSGEWSIAGTIRKANDD